MKECGIVVDFEWAYNMVMAYDEVKCQSPSWVKSFVEGWRKGYKEGYLTGWTEGSIRTVSRMKYYGISPETIAAATGLSLDVIDLIKAGDTTIK